MGFGMISIVSTLMFSLVSVLMIVTIVKNINQWNKNNHSPKLIVEATVVSKRSRVSHHDHHASSFYYVTFEFETKDRMEFHVSGAEFGMLVEGDVGELTFQGTSYLGFERL